MPDSFVRFFLIVGLLLGPALPAPAQPGPGGARIDSLVRSMTLEEKLSFLHGTGFPNEEGGAGATAGVPRLSVPRLRMADGPAGIRTFRPATALPAPVSLAASFSPALARRFGSVLGREGRARDHDVLLAPMVNVVRVPEAGRNFETLGEDPLLASRMVAAEVRGVQREGMIATVKHYAVNNFERERGSVSAEVGERALHEIYLSGFEAAVRAGAGAVMCAYNRVNGTHACENETLLQDLLRDRFGFDGWVMTDWGADHSLDAIHDGLDQEMPEAVYFGDSLRAAVEAGTVPERRIDRSVRRVLGQMAEVDLLGGSVPERPEIDAEAGARVARDVAEAGAVLLRNEDGTLPLSENDLSSLAVVGPTAKHLLYGGGGSSRVRTLRLTDPLAALRERAGEDGNVRYVPGIDHSGRTVPRSALSPGEGADGNGLRRVRSTGGASPTIDPTLDATGDESLPEGSSWTWTGTITAPSSGVYDLKIQTKGGDGRLYLDGEEVVGTAGLFSGASLIPAEGGLWSASVKLEFDEGETRRIEVTAEGGTFGFLGPRDGPLRVRLAWVTPERRREVRREAVEAARRAEAAVVFAYNEGTEGRDRTSLALPGTQDELIQRVSEAADRTTVVLNTGDPVRMPWLDATGAVLQMWYPGQEGGTATARLLTGEANPGGKLPVTFPGRGEETPTHPDERYPGTDGTARYSEGVFVGYRWYDEHGVAPLFPFGHGLSYTSFSYSDLEVETTDRGYRVRFRVRNAGDRRGAEVPQVYLGPPADPAVPMPPRELVGFERVPLDAGEDTTVTVSLERRSLSYWSVEEDGWRLAEGRRPVWIGSSSRDLRLEGHLPAAVPEPR